VLLRLVLLIRPFGGPSPTRRPPHPLCGRPSVVEK
jgi:hypothetical protein